MLNTDKIFNRFNSNRPEKFGEHSGLGLNIVKNLVELHNGEIIATNNNLTHQKVCSEIKKIIMEYDLYPFEN